MRLSELLAPRPIDPALGALDVAGLSADSRTIDVGFAFFAIPGHAGDGLDYLADARTRGARVVSRGRPHGKGGNMDLVKQVLRETLRKLDAS